MSSLVRKGILLLAVLASLVGAPAAAAANAATAAAPPSELALPLQDVPSLSFTPPGFTSNGHQAIAAAEATAAMQALHRDHHPLQIRVQTWSNTNWEVDFYYRGSLLAEVDVTRAGRATAVWVGPLAYDYGARGHFSGLFDSPWIVFPFAVMFLVPFLDRRRRLRLLHLDLLVMLSFGLSYWLFNTTHFVASVWLFYPPLLYLLGRMLALGLRHDRAAEGEVAEATFLPLPALALGLIALVAARIGLDLATHKVIDVGYASVIGAHRIAHHLPLYYASDAHGDTYGPVAYLAYLPFEQLWPFKGFDYSPAAHAAAISFDVLTIAGLVALGVRLRGGVRGWRLGLTLGWAFAAFPFTLLGLMNNTNDGLVALLLVLTLLAMRSPAGRGALLGLAAAAKFIPVALLPVIARGRGDRDLRGAVLCVAGVGVVATVAILAYLPSGGLPELYDHTIGYQLGRSDPSSLWGLHPSLGWLKTVVSVAAVLLACALALGRGRRSLAQVAAISAAIVIAVQLPAEHWFYFYIVWFAPLVLVALIARGPSAPNAMPATAQPSDAKRRQRLLGVTSA